MTKKSFLTCDPLITRAEAKRLGLVRYYSDKPCPKNHASDRMTKTTSCAQCASERASEYYALHEKRIRERVKNYAIENAAQVSEYRKDYASKNKEKLQSLARDYYKNNRGKILEKVSERYRRFCEESPEVAKQTFAARTKKWRENNPDKWAEIVKNYYQENKKEHKDRARLHRAQNRDMYREYSNARRARKHSSPGRYTPADVLSKLVEQDFLCSGCSVSFNEVKYTVDHILPLKLGGTNFPENIQILCKPCNSSKNSKHPDDWIPKNPPPKKDTLSE